MPSYVPGAGVELLRVMGEFRGRPPMVYFGEERQPERLPM